MRPPAVLLAVSCAFTGLGCGEAAAPSGTDDPVIARLGGEPIRKSEVGAAAAFRLYRHEVASYTLLERETARLVDERVVAAEARQRGLSPAALLAQIEAEVPAPSEAEVDRYLARHPGAEGPPDLVRQRVRDHLARAARIERRLEFVASLRERAGFEWLLPKPQPPRTQFEAPDAPARGPADAPVTIFHLASFGSVASARSAQALERLLEEFPARVRWLHVNLPGERDEAGRRAAELGFAAQDAGRFWELHDALFAREGRLDADALAASARDAGLPSDFIERSDQPALTRRLEADVALARRAGALREPTLFVNGVYWSATGPYTELRELVEKELARTSSSR